MSPSLTPPGAVLRSLAHWRVELLRDRELGRLFQQVRRGRQTHLDGVCGSSLALIAAALAGAAPPGPVVIVCPVAGIIEAVPADLRLFC